MRGSDNATVSALAAARTKGLRPRALVTIRARSLANETEELFCFWNGVLPAEIEVLGGASGMLEQRSFAADGALLKVSNIRLTSDLTFRPATINLNPLHPRVALMLSNFDIRLAPVEIHRVPVDVDTGLLVAPPRCRFLGAVETVKRVRPKINEEGSLTLNCISDTAQLTRPNWAKRSDETQKLRSGDRMMKYAEVVGEWELNWGEADGKPEANGSSGAGKGNTPR